MGKRPLLNTECSGEKFFFFFKKAKQRQSEVSGAERRRAKDQGFELEIQQSLVRSRSVKQEPQLTSQCCGEESFGQITLAVHCKSHAQAYIIFKL